MARKFNFSKVPAKKPRKKVELTESQKEAQALKMAKLREARAKKRGNAPPKNVHHSVVSLPDDHNLSLKNVRQWIKHNKELLTEERKLIRKGHKGAEARASYIEGYIRHMDYYIKHGDWIDNKWGKDQEYNIKWLQVAP